MVTTIVTRGTQGPPGPPGAPGSVQPLGPGTVTRAMLAPGVLPANTDALPPGPANRYLTLAGLSDLIAVDPGTMTKTVGEAAITLSATGGGGGGSFSGDTDDVPEGNVNKYATRDWLFNILATSGLTKSISGSQVLLTATGGSSFSGTTDDIDEGDLNKFLTGPGLNARLAVSGGLTKAYNSATGVVTIGGSTGSGNLSPADQAKLNSMKVWVPSDPSGATDMTAELEAFVAANQGHMVKVPDSATILLKNAFKTVTTGHIWIDFGKATIKYKATSQSDFALYCDNTARASAEVPVTGVTETVINTDARVSRAATSGTLSAQRFDWVALYGNDANPARPGGRLGEIAQLTTAPSSGSLTFTRRLNYHALYSAGLRARRLDKSRTLHLRGGTFTADGNPHTASITARPGAILVQGFVDPLVEDIRFVNVWSEGVRFQCCAAPRWRDLFYGDVGNLANSQGYTYGVRLYGMNDAADGRNTITRNARHGAFTTDGTSDAPTVSGGQWSNWFRMGVPTNWAVTGVHAYNCGASPIDTHEEGDGGVFSDITVWYPYQDENISGNFTGLGVQLRSSNTILKNYTQYGGTRGVKVENYEYGFEDQVIFENCSFHHTTAGATADSDVGIQIESFAGMATTRHVILDGVVFNDVGTGVQCKGFNKVTITGLHARRCKTPLDVGGGSRVNVPGPSSFDFRANGRPIGAGVVVQRGSGGASSVVFGARPVVLRDTPAPAAFFAAGDSSSKAHWAPGVTDIRSGSATSAIALRSGTGWTSAPVSEVAWTAP